MLQAYGNVDGDSSVRAYETGPDWIDVHFSDGSAYRYSHRSCGAGNCEHMKRLAASGDGLNSFIMRNVRKQYESKVR